MKTILYCSLIIVMIICGCSQPKSSKIEGAWQLVSWRNFVGDSLVWDFPRDLTGSDIIILSERHILSVGNFKRDTAMMNNFVGATYTLDGNHFEETLLYFPESNMIGHKVKQTLELKNDTLIKTYPFDDNWKLIKNGYSIEKYIRLK